MITFVPVFFWCWVASCLSGGCLAPLRRGMATKIIAVDSLERGSHFGTRRSRSCVPSSHGVAGTLSGTDPSHKSWDGAPAPNFKGLASHRERIFFCRINFFPRETFISLIRFFFAWHPPKEGVFKIGGGPMEQPPHHKRGIFPALGVRRPRQKALEWGGWSRV